MGIYDPSKYDPSKKITFGVNVNPQPVNALTPSYGNNVSAFTDPVMQSSQQWSPQNNSPSSLALIQKQVQSPNGAMANNASQSPYVPPYMFDPFASKAVAPTTPPTPMFDVAQQPNTMMTFDQWTELDNKNKQELARPSGMITREQWIEANNRNKPQEFKFDPTTDPRFQAFKKIYDKQGEESFNNNIASLTANAGGGEDSWAETIASKARNSYDEKLMGMVPELETNAYNRFQDQIKNDATYGGVYNGSPTPEALSKISTINKNTADVKETANKNSLEAADKEATRTGWYINPQVKQALSAPIPTQYIPVVQQYASDFAAEINRRSAADPSDPLIPMLEAARYQKVMNDPVLREKYMSNYYTQTLEGKKSATEIQGKQLANVKAEVEAIIAQATMTDKVQEAKIDVEKKLQDIEKGRVDIQKGIADINDILTQTRLRPVQTAIAQQNANSSSSSASTSAYNAETSRARYNYDIDPNNPDNIYKKAQVDNMGNKPLEDLAEQTYKDLTPMIQELQKNSVDDPWYASPTDNWKSVGSQDRQDAAVKLRTEMNMRQVPNQVQEAIFKRIGLTEFLK